VSIWSRVKALVGRVFNRAPSGYADPRDFQRTVNYTYAGVVVTPDISLQVSTVWACIDVISKSIASSPFEVFLRLRNGDRELLPMDPLVWLMNCRPNADMTAMAFREALTSQALLVGAGYAEIEYDARGAITALWPLWWEDVEPMRAETGELVYDVTDRYRYSGAGKRRLEQWRIFHLRGSSLCGWVGEGVAIRAANSIALAIAQERFAATFFGNGTNVGGKLTVQGVLDQVQKQELREDFEAAYRGSAKSHRPLILEGGMDYVPLTPDAQKAQMTEARQHSVEEICRWFGVPPHKVGHLLRSTNNNIEHQGIEFTRDGLRPWAFRWQQEADYKLFSTRGPWKFVLIDLEWASQGDFKSRMEGYQIARRIGVYSVNDVLRAEGKNTIGEDGDSRMVEMNMQLLDQLGEQAEAMGGQAEPPDPEDTEDTSDPLVMSIRTFAASVYERGARRRQSYESQMAARPNAESLEKRAAFLESQQAVMRRDLDPVVKLIARTWGYSNQSEVERTAMNCAADLFSADGRIAPDEWAGQLVALYQKDKQ